MGDLTRDRPPHTLLYTLEPWNQALWLRSSKASVEGRKARTDGCARMGPLLITMVFLGCWRFCLRKQCCLLSVFHDKHESAIFPEKQKKAISSRGRREHSGAPRLPSRGCTKRGHQMLYTLPRCEGFVPRACLTLIGVWGGCQDLKPEGTRVRALTSQPQWGGGGTAESASKRRGYSARVGAPWPHILPVIWKPTPRAPRRAQALCTVQDASGGCPAGGTCCLWREQTWERFCPLHHPMGSPRKHSEAPGAATRSSHR